MSINLFGNQLHCHGMSFHQADDFPDDGIVPLLQFPMIMMVKNLIDILTASERLYRQLFPIAKARKISSGGDQQFTVQPRVIGPVEIVHNQQRPMITELPELAQFPSPVLLRLFLRIRTKVPDPGSMIVQDHCIDITEIGHKQDRVIAVLILIRILFCQFTFTDAANTAEEQSPVFVQQVMDLPQLSLTPDKKVLDCRKLFPDKRFFGIGKADDGFQLLPQFIGSLISFFHSTAKGFLQQCFQQRENTGIDPLEDPCFVIKGISGKTPALAFLRMPAEDLDKDDLSYGINVRSSADFLVPAGKFLLRGCPFPGEGKTAAFFDNVKLSYTVEVKQHHILDRFFFRTHQNIIRLDIQMQQIFLVIISQYSG